MKILDKKDKIKVVIRHKILTTCYKTADLVVEELDNVVERFYKIGEIRDVKVDGWVGDYRRGFGESIITGRRRRPREWWIRRRSSWS